ncbi:MAG: DUF362 domain-containing protein [Anaerolineae bacterium]|nr:DUF362 domain-containing protein [Anaerolineae bacterium]
MKLHKIRQQFSDLPAVDAYASCRESLRNNGMLQSVRAGQRVCLGLPSRGISGLAELVRACVDALLECGAEVVIVPAMGSHGGGTAQGQAAVLADFGIDEAHLGVPVVSRMEAVSLGTARTAGGTAVEVFWDAEAARADHVLVVNRIKAHTAFSGPHESGLMKILTVGLGKAAGAREIHARGLGEAMPAAARFVLANQPILGGVAVVENARHQPVVVEAIPALQLPQRESELLALSKTMLPTLPTDRLDVLVVRWMGKNLSGTGMDTNVIGKYRRNWGEPEPNFARIVVLDLTDASHGNAAGVGFADVITRRLYDKIDYDATLLNCLTAGNFNGAKIPAIQPTDRAAIECAMAGFDVDLLRMAVIESTLSLEELWVSECVYAELTESRDILPCSQQVDLEDSFSASGTLNLLAD